MTKIMFFGTRAYEKDMALRWGKKNNIDVTTSTELLSVDTVDQLKDYDGVTTMQFGKLESEVYPKLESYGIKQIAQRTAGFDMYDLELAKKNMKLLSRIYLVIHLKQLLNIRYLSLCNSYENSQQLKNVCKHIISHGRPLLCLVQ